MLRFIEELGDTVQLVAQRFFHQHMRARSDRPAGSLDVQTGRIGNQDYVWPLTIQGRVEIVCLDRVDAERLGLMCVRLAADDDGA
jgi:hypothetical protein